MLFFPSRELDALSIIPLLNVFLTEAAVEERLKQLERWKERKALQKEKEKREKERKGVFKTGIYHPKDRLVVFSLPQAPAASTTGKEVRQE